MNSRELSIAILKDALEIVSDEKRWTTKTLARKSDGLPCTPYDPLAVCFCAEGAVRRCVRLRGAETGTAEYLMRLLDRQVDRSDIAYVNDEQGRLAVVKALKQLISKLRAA